MSKIPCPLCGNPMDRNSNRCGDCSNYGRKRHVMPSGYVRVWVPGHPVANSDGYALEHRYVLYEAGYEIQKGFGSHVHHINGDKQDNRIENLMMRTAENHSRGHAVERGYVTNQHGAHPPRNFPTDE